MIKYTSFSQGYSQYNLLDVFPQIDFSPVGSWITDQTVERKLRAHRVYVISVNLCGCTMVQDSSFRRISKTTLISLKITHIFNFDQWYDKDIACVLFSKVNAEIFKNSIWVNAKMLMQVENKHVVIIGFAASYQSNTCFVWKQSWQDENMKMILEGCHSLLYLNLALTHISNGTIRVLSRYKRLICFSVHKHNRNNNCICIVLVLTVVWKMLCDAAVSESGTLHGFLW